MSLKNKLPQKRIRKAKRLAHAEMQQRGVSFIQYSWLKMKNKYGNFVYKWMK